METLHTSRCIIPIYASVVTWHIPVCFCLLDFTYSFDYKLLGAKDIRILISSESWTLSNCWTWTNLCFTKKSMIWRRVLNVCRVNEPGNGLRVCTLISVPPGFICNCRGLVVLLKPGNPGNSSQHQDLESQWHRYKLFVSDSIFIKNGIALGQWKKCITR